MSAWLRRTRRAIGSGQVIADVRKEYRSASLQTEIDQMDVHQKSSDDVSKLLLMANLRDDSCPVSYVRRYSTDFRATEFQRRGWGNGTNESLVDQSTSRTAATAPLQPNEIERRLSPRIVRRQGFDRFTEFLDLTPASAFEEDNPNRAIDLTLHRCHFGCLAPPHPTCHRFRAGHRGRSERI